MYQALQDHGRGNRPAVMGGVELRHRARRGRVARPRNSGWLHFFELSVVLAAGR